MSKRSVECNERSVECNERSAKWRDDLPTLYRINITNPLVSGDLIELKYNGKILGRWIYTKDKDSVVEGDYILVPTYFK